MTPRAAFTDDVQMQLRIKLDGRGMQRLNLSDPSRVVAARITVQPGAKFPWHTHPGPVIVTVAQGELTYVRADDCVKRRYPTGTVFVDPGRGNVHTAYNSSGGTERLLRIDTRGEQCDPESHGLAGEPMSRNRLRETVERS